MRETGNQKFELSEPPRYKVLSAQEAAEVENIFSKKIQQWHDIAKPDFIVVTATSAVSYGILIKAVWKEAYSNEKQPAFLVIDPRKIAVNFKPQQTDLEPLPSKDLLGPQSRVLVFDESTTSDIESLTEFFNNSAEPTNVEGGLEESTSLKRSAHYIHNLGVNKIWLDSNGTEDLHQIAQKGRIIKRKNNVFMGIGIPLEVFRESLTLVRRSKDTKRNSDLNAGKLAQDLKLIAENIAKHLIETK